MQVTSTFAEGFNALLDAYQRIYESLPSLERFEALFAHDPLVVRALEEIFTDIFDFHAKALKYFRGNGE